MDFALTVRKAKSFFVRILHCVESYYPAEHGMAEQVRQVSERIVALGHSVTVVTSVHCDRKSAEHNGVAIVEFDVHGNLALGLRGDVEAYRNFLVHNNYDVIVCFAAQQWATDAVFGVLSQVTAKKVFVPVGFSGLQNEVYRDYFNELPEVMRKFDAHIFLSDTYQDINFARQHDITNLAVIPNGADENEFNGIQYHNILSDLNITTEKSLLLVGNHTGAKGHQDAMRIFSNADVADVTLCIVGREEDQEKRSIKNFLRNLLYHSSLCTWGPGCYNSCCQLAQRLNNSRRFKKQNKKIILSELSRAQLVSLYQVVDLMLFPSFIECSPIVLFEAAASGTPFLSTDVGNAREIAERTGGGRILPTKIWRKGLKKAEISSSSKMLEECLNDSDWLARASKTSKRAWRENYTWEHISQRYLDVYLALL